MKGAQELGAMVSEGEVETGGPAEWKGGVGSGEGPTLVSLKWE